MKKGSTVPWSLTPVGADGAGIVVVRDLALDHGPLLGRFHLAGEVEAEVCRPR